MSIAILGSGAFGAALAIALGHHRPVLLWGRGLTGRRIARLPDAVLPPDVTVSNNPADIAPARIILLALPMQSLGAFCRDHHTLLAGKYVIACSKGIDLATGLGPTSLLKSLHPTPAILTGPSFAVDIAKNMPTALTLACQDDRLGAYLQITLSTPCLRLYRSTDVIGAELGGALKNIIAIGAGLVTGAGLGDSARAALITRGYAEMLRFALAQGARAETLAGLSGFGDLILTCTSPLSRNFRFGHALGSKQTFDSTQTVEGVASAQALAHLAIQQKIDMPIVQMICALLSQRITLQDAIQELLTRPLKQE